MNEFIEGIKQGAREAPRSLIAPLVLIWVGFKRMMEFMENYAKGEQNHH